VKSESPTPPSPAVDAPQTPEQRSPLGRLIRLCLEHRLAVLLVLIAALLAGVAVAPFNWKLWGIERHPIAVDAIPDIGENQQIVFTQWAGHSPQDIEDQISYRLTVALLGIPSVKTIRSYSMFGFSSIYVVFKEDVEFYWARSRLLEKLSSLPAGTLPEGVRPALGSDATALGQVFWYTLEGHDPDGKPCGGWDQEELRTIQDWYARYWLLAAEGVAEVASVGGFVREYQVDVDPDAMRAHGVSLGQVFEAVKGANMDVGAGTLELNRVEYLVRGVGLVTSLEEIENSVVAVGDDHVPVLVRHVAHVALGPAPRRGALDKGGAPAVGGVVVARYGANPLDVINHVKEQIVRTRDALPAKVLLDESIAPRETMATYATEHDFAPFDGPRIQQAEWLSHLRGLPREQWPEWATISQVTIKPFYDRSGLIYETLGTLNAAIGQQILITVIVVLIMVMHLRSGLLISSMLPISVLLCFVAMKLFGVQANIVALSGIAIAIGTIVDMGIVLCENILRQLDDAAPGSSTLEVVHRAASEVGGAVLTAVLTTVISFLPIFTMVGPEGKLFKPLAFTKTFALLASVIVALLVLPPAAYALFRRRSRTPRRPAEWWSLRNRSTWVNSAIVLVLGGVLAAYWEPLGPERGLLRNMLFVGMAMGLILGGFHLFQRGYAGILGWCLTHKRTFLAVPTVLLFLGVMVWLGFPKLSGWLPQTIRQSRPAVALAHQFPGLGKEFMPSLDEGSFLWMPTTTTHASIGEALDILAMQDAAFANIPEIDSAVGKLGRAETPLDPAPISMIETVINYKPEYRADANGRRLSFRYNRQSQTFPRDAQGELIPDRRGRPFRQWRDHIRTPDDIWQEIVRVAKLPGTTSAPKLQPIATRLVMLQSGMRAPMGVKVTGPTLDAIEAAGLQIERLLKQVPGVSPATVIADRIVGKPYLEIRPDRLALARYGIPMESFQRTLSTAIGGTQVSTTIQGRERFPIRVRYPRERRDSIEAIQHTMVQTARKQQIPLSQLADIEYVRGPQTIKSEDTFLIGYVLFDKRDGYAEVDVVKQCQNFLNAKRESGDLQLPAGVSYLFAGNYENQLRAARKLALILPIALIAIFILIYFLFRSLPLTAFVFTSVFVAWAGGFLLIWLYGQPRFLDITCFGVNLRTLFQIHPINLSVAVWVGFLALFGIATDDGVVMGTYLTQHLRERAPTTRDALHRAIVEAGQRRVRPCLMTTATTLLALLPILTSTGRGSDVMIPMAIPCFGGMLVEVITMLIVPVLFAWSSERRLGKLQGTRL
jgi:Cu(I)/Ag(I) efflux system membrane protein CusA/SilA